jgi:hypothetical protein
MSDLIALPSLIFPGIRPSITPSENGLTIYDPVRRIRVALTPEEWVRQHVVSWLVNTHRYPIGRFSVERSVGRTGMRYDILVVDAHLQGFLLVECKAPDIRINADVMRQSAWYNLTLKTPFVMLTNGREAFIAEVGTDGAMTFLTDAPTYPTP